ncbi:hypothetical protein B7R21_16250 [Subtercola boreus]|uniref:Peptidase M16 N-terminal domain-containing protein n=1 Tax=Subtercola boreus TaxID=120213 RepID=A0A3E0VC30_9MICO|nr:hypothetical protein B7R21_16250 [Subtercola boreus]
MGFKDEPTTLLGITHLLEHVVLNLVQPVIVAHDAVTTSESVVFTAWGDPDDVAGFLNDVAEAVCRISSISDAVLVAEKLSVEAESPTQYASPTSGLLTYRYGIPGIGSANFGVPGTASLTRQEVIDWSAQWFVSDNAILTFTSPSPETLNVILPPGSPDRATADLASIDTPVLVESAKEGVALSLVVEEGVAEFLAEALWHELIATLRYDLNLIYSVRVITTRVDERSCEIAFVLDPLPRNTARTVRMSIAALRRISRKGFSPATVLAVQKSADLEEADTTTHASFLHAAAIDHLLDRTSVSGIQRLRDAQRATSESLRQALRNHLSTLIVAYDEAEVKRSDLPDRSIIARDQYWPWQQRSAGGGTADVSHLPTWPSRDGKSALSITPTHLVETSSRRPIEIAFADIRLVGITQDNALTLIDHRGRSTTIDESDAVNFETLRHAILERIPTSIIRDFAK